MLLAESEQQRDRRKEKKFNWAPNVLRAWVPLHRHNNNFSTQGDDESDWLLIIRSRAISRCRLMTSTVMATSFNYCPHRTIRRPQASFNDTQYRGTNPTACSQQLQCVVCVLKLESCVRMRRLCVMKFSSPALAPFILAIHARILGAMLTSCKDIPRS
jgi:hypothetical protein